MMSKEDLNLLLVGWIDGDIDFHILVPNPKAGEERKLLDSGEVRGLAELISARVNDVSSLKFNSATIKSRPPR